MHKTLGLWNISIFQYKTFKIHACLKIVLWNRSIIAPTEFFDSELKWTYLRRKLESDLTSNWKFPLWAFDLLCNRIIRFCVITVHSWNQSTVFKVFLSSKSFLLIRKVSHWSGLGFNKFFYRVKRQLKLRLSFFFCTFS